MLRLTRNTSTAASSTPARWAGGRSSIAPRTKSPWASGLRGLVVSCWLPLRGDTLKLIVRLISQARLRPANRRAFSSKLDVRQFAVRNAVPCGHFASLVRSPATRSARLPFESSLSLLIFGASVGVAPNTQTRKSHERTRKGKSGKVEEWKGGSVEGWKSWGNLVIRDAAKDSVVLVKYMCRS